jgi:deoxycytidylate deaminase
MNFIQKAIELAEKSTYLTHNHGAVLVYRKTIIGMGFNHSFVHAEEDCLNHVLPKYRHRIPFAVLYVVRYKNNILKNSAPCVNCQKLIIDHSIKKVVYSFDNKTLVEMKFKNM